MEKSEIPRFYLSRKCATGHSLISSNGISKIDAIYYWITFCLKLAHPQIGPFATLALAHYDCQLIIESCYKAKQRAKDSMLWGGKDGGEDGKQRIYATEMLAAAPKANWLECTRLTPLIY